jgi:ATP:ADP antiporter, AAA family
VKTNVLSFLGVKHDEQAQVFLMLGTGFFLGIFIATYQVTAESLFLNKLSDQLDEAFLVSGLLGILSTAVFSFLQNRMRFISLSILSLLIIIGATFNLYYFYHNGVEEVQDNTLFFMYCLIGPITAILLLCYWGIFGRLFNFKQSKRIIGWIDTGQLIAIIAANFLIPITSNLFPDTSDYLLVCNFSIVGALICLIIISIKFDLARVSTDASVREQTKFTKIFKDRYVVLLSLFLITSMVTFIFNQFTFQTLLNKQYPDQRDLTNFLAFFNGAIYALSLLMQIFVNDKILGTYGIRISLFVLPAVVSLLIVGSLITGSIFGFNLDENPQTFIYFFLFVALTRLFNSMLRDSFENPVYKLLFIPIDNRYRFSIQAKVEGVVNESGRLIAGAFIFLFALLPFFNLLWISVIVLVLLILYFIISNNLYAEYKHKIRAKLENTGIYQDALEIGYSRIISRLEEYLSFPNSSRSIFSFKLLEKINPTHIGVWVNTLMKSSDEKTRDFAQKRMNEIKGLSVSENYVIKIDPSRISSDQKNILSKLDLDLLLNSGGDIQKARIQRLARSLDSKDRHYAAELLLHTDSIEYVSFLIELLNDNDTQVRLVAIKTAVKKYNNEVIASLIENLGNTLYGNAAMNALIQIGQPALQLLDNSFYRSGQSSQVMTRIVQIIGSIGGNKAKDFLWNKIDYPDKVIVSQVLYALGRAGFKAGLAQVSRIKYAIESDVADIAWNLGAIEEISEHPESPIVKMALEREVQNDVDHIYMLLAMLYDTRSIQLVKENIESGTSEGVTYAIELLDVFLSDQLKQRVIPILDDVSNIEKVKRLELFYPRIPLDEKMVLKFLINRDFTQSNRWTKACVLHQIGVERIEDFTLDLIAQLFNPDQLIRETAAWALLQIDQELYHSNSIRLGNDIKKSLDAAILGRGVQTPILIYDKVLFLQRIELFEGIAGVTLSYVADMSSNVFMKKGDVLVINETLSNEFLLVYTGHIQHAELGHPVINFIPGQFLGEQLIDIKKGYTNTLIAEEETVLLKFNKDEFYELISDQVKLADKILEYI